MIGVGRLEDWRWVGDSPGDVGDERADMGLSRNSWAICAVLGFPCLASLTTREFLHSGELHAGVEARGGGEALTGEEVRTGEELRTGEEVRTG